MKNLNFSVGDTVRVFTKDPQDQKVHSTPFQGIVVAIRGQKQDRTFRVLKNASDNVTVERIFPLNSPTIENIVLVKKGSFRRSKLYFLARNRKS